MTEIPSLHSWKFYLSPRECWEAMYEDCKMAKHSIEFEQYIIENDEIGRKFLELFIKKAQEGLRVIITCDSFGSRALIGSPLIKKFREAGGTFYFYQPLKYFRIFYPKYWFPRTHIKTLLIDSRIVYSGGVCIAYRMRHWRDTHIRITGPIALDVRKAFDRNLNEIDKTKDFYYLQNRTIKSSYVIYRELKKQIEQAKNYIYISTAFFIPDDYFLSLLKKAATRGVKVEILTTQYSEHPIVDWVALLYFKKLLKKNISIFLYQKNILHCKVIVIDDNWATIGSSNMDILSFFYNREANVIINEKAAIAELKGHFLNDLNFSIKLSRNFFKMIPLWKKIMGFLARSFKFFFRRRLE